MRRENDRRGIKRVRRGPQIAVRTRRCEGEKVVLDGAGSPRLVRVREPDQLGVERAHSQLAFGVRLVELAEPDRHVAADDDRTPACLDDDHLHAACSARRKVVEIERIALDVVSCGHVFQDDDLALDSLEASGCWNELEPRVQEIGPALTLEDDLLLFTYEPEKDLHLGSIPRGRCANPRPTASSM
jgi:hypothetical protein